ncbi:hypothetical protein LPB67_08685 [Undibacterium sp. Jales W-56]|uniref:hypothetical protein n=1 Tax=Undibacterium sp. Jales W-56 TaxID=2897325 RepID=UPI0021D3461E|nr:hypothetical protein [Undibacterium sp. Jales W-56]MCU6433852.1 hypothetical protein [Undibacterium sp. Jales W-56]
MLSKYSGDSHIAAMKRQLDELNFTMQELEAKTQKAREEAHEKYVMEMAKLREQSELAAEKLMEPKDAAEESWKDLVIGTDKVRDAFIKTFHDFKAKH